LQNVHNKNLTEYYDLFLEQNEMTEELTVNIIMPFYPKGDLACYINSLEGNLSEEVIKTKKLKF
jgi:serine/threonine protein kinase